MGTSLFPDSAHRVPRSSRPNTTGLCVHRRSSGRGRLMSTVQETERTYEGRPGHALPGLAGLPRVAATSGPEEQVLDADYYDTDDLRLIRNGITLRRRRGGSDPGWHLKLPLGGDTRREIRRPPGRGRAVPEELARLVQAYTRGAELRLVAR